MYTLEVIEIYHQRLPARRAQVTVVPALVRERPLSLPNAVGRLWYEHHVPAGRDLQRG